MLTKDEFLDVRAEIGHLMADVRDLTTYKEDYKIRHMDLDKKLHELQLNSEESQLLQLELQAKCQIYDQRLDGKLEAERFEEEIDQLRKETSEHANHIMGQGGKGGVASGMPALNKAQSVMIPQRTIRKGGLSNADKQRFGVFEETLERIQTQQRKINDTLRNMKLDEIKLQIKTLTEKMAVAVTKDSVSDFQNDLLVEFNIVKNNQKVNVEKIDNIKESMESKLGDQRD